MGGISIGDASRTCGVKIPTIRYYEQIGLLPAPARRENQRRLYTREDLQRLAFIRHARELGFEIDAIRTLLALQDHPNQSCELADQTAKAHLTAVERRIKSLNALRDELKRMVEDCGRGHISDCRVIETLADQSHSHGRLAD